MSRLWCGLDIPCDEVIPQLHRNPSPGGTRCGRPAGTHHGIDGPGIPESV